eukprot:COSAG06_NODE_46721_length_344_cov_1.383673_1_plen_57_part_00
MLHAAVTAANKHLSIYKIRWIYMMDLLKKCTFAVDEDDRSAVDYDERLAVADGLEP